MMKKQILALLLVLPVVIKAQKVSEIDFDAIKSTIEERSSSLYYPDLLKRFTAFDTTMTEMDYRHLYYGQVFQEDYSPYGEAEKEDDFNDLYKEEKFENAIKPGLKILEKNPVNLKMIFKVLVCYHMTGDKTTAGKYAKQYLGLLGAIYGSGNGKSRQTAFVVAKVADEYEVMRDLELSHTLQSLQGDTDVMEIDPKGQEGHEVIETLYFNVSKPLQHLNKMFEKK